MKIKRNSWWKQSIYDKTLYRIWIHYPKKRGEKHLLRVRKKVKKISWERWKLKTKL